MDEPFNVTISLINVNSLVGEGLIINDLYKQQTTSNNEQQTLIVPIEVLLGKFLIYNEQLYWQN